ncbi:hypothetical protein GT347_15945 [Xylophilus rhododendri]|uniref:Uncharacterized protein n=1 Tax=Xylophilus rhododendri TaxID=2697032 RepID=A0A857J687_9BURK|nr:hypothetical protein [Xylophilus rhododendri]QHI99336.1 hypothetical protein GT347_15945 [Xylophilus rhododendri]
MNFFQHSSNNRVLGAPAGWYQGALPVGALPITDVMQNDVPSVVSFWRPDAAELAALNAGGAVMLFVVGRTMHPVRVEVTTPETAT